MPQVPDQGYTPQPKPRPNISPVKVYVKPEARRATQAVKAVRFINQEVGRKVVKLTAQPTKAQITIHRGPNEGGGGYTYGMPATPGQVLRGKPTRIRINASPKANLVAGFEGASKDFPHRTTSKFFQRTGRLGGNLSRDRDFNPTVAQTTAHEISHALGLTHRIKNKRRHIMDWSSSRYGQGEIGTIRYNTNPANIPKGRR